MIFYSSMQYFLPLFNNQVPRLFHRVLPSLLVKPSQLPMVLDRLRHQMALACLRLVPGVTRLLPALLLQVGLCMEFATFQTQCNLKWGCNIIIKHKELPLERWVNFNFWCTSWRPSKVVVTAVSRFHAQLSKLCIAPVNRAFNKTQHLPEFQQVFCCKSPPTLGWIISWMITSMVLNCHLL